jgi:antitoxin VapB
VNAELAEKRRRLHLLLDREGLDALVLRRPGNVAWYSGGGRTHILATPDVGVADVVIRREGDEVVTAVNEAGRLEAEELGGLEARFEVVPWGADRERALPISARTGADSPLPGTRDVSAGVEAARRSLTAAEVDRFRELGAEAAAAMTDTCSGLSPGDDEFRAASRVASALIERGVEPVVLLVAGAGRLPVHRHPLPTAAPLGKLAMIVVCARACGLIASLTRFVAFERLPADLEDAYVRLLNVDTAFNLATCPGRTVAAAFDTGTGAYALNGFDEEEWLLHHQGGPTGYEARDYLADSESMATTEDAQAFAWNPIAPCLKSEDTILAGASGPEILTVDSRWPCITVEGLSRPLMLVR